MIYMTVYLIVGLFLAEATNLNHRKSTGTDMVFKAYVITVLLWPYFVVGSFTKED